MRKILISTAAVLAFTAANAAFAQTSAPAGAAPAAKPAKAAPAKKKAAAPAATPAADQFEDKVVIRTWRQLTPETAAAMRQGAIDTYRLIAGARADLKADKPAAARTKLESALTTLIGIRANEPITTVRAKVENASKTEEADVLAVYRRDLVPVAAVVDAHESVTDVGKVKVDLQNANAAANANDPAKTKAELYKVKEHLDAAIAEMPITKTFDLVAAAAEAIRAKNPKKADALLRQAQNAVVIKVIDIRAKGAVAVPTKAKPAAAPAAKKS